MSPKRQNIDLDPDSVDVTGFDTVSKGDQLLDRVKVVAQRILERVRRATEETRTDVPTFTDQTELDSQPLDPVPPPRPDPLGS